MGQIGAIRVTTQAVLLIPGVNGTLTAISINGSPAASERIRIDGLDATYTLGNAYYSFGAPSVDSLSEVAIQTSNYAAEYGQSTGAVLSYTMRSGTNQYHGSAYDYWTNEAFNAYGAYSHTRNKSRINDFGGTAGGPVWIPKSLQGQRQDLFLLQLRVPSHHHHQHQQRCSLFPRRRIGPAILAQPRRRPAIRFWERIPLGRPIIQNSIYDPRHAAVQYPRRIHGLSGIRSREQRDSAHPARYGRFESSSLDPAAAGTVRDRVDPKLRKPIYRPSPSTIFLRSRSTTR